MNTGQPLARTFLLSAGGLLALLAGCGGSDAAAPGAAVGPGAAGGGAGTSAGGAAGTSAGGAGPGGKSSGVGGGSGAGGKSGKAGAGGANGGGASGQGGEAGADCGSTPTLPAVQALFGTRCAGGSCHSAGPGGMFPPLADAAPSSWVGLASHKPGGLPLVVPGHPEQSFLYMKVTGMQGPDGGALMPLGAAMPIAEITVIHDWIAAGAPHSCVASNPGPPASTDPNTLAQDALFTCPAGAPPSSSPARIRRIDAPEWTRAIPKPLNGNVSGSRSDAWLNPFTAAVGQAYSTYARGVTIDTATLDLYFQVLPEAPGSWVHADPWSAGTGLRLKGVNDDGKLDCMYGDSGKVQAAPGDACIDTYVDRLLTVGVLARTPTADEHAHLRALLVTALAAENGDVTQRPATLALVDQAAWLTAGALFRSELGSPAAGDPAKRSRLSNEELALVVGGMLSYHRPGAPMLGGPANGFQTPPDPDDACHPWLHLIREAADDGTLQDPAVIKKLIAAYGGGVDPGGQPAACGSGVTVRRRDLSTEEDDRYLNARGEYWLAPRIAGFFREWLGYGNANTVFKDQPGGTSRFATTTSPYDRTASSFWNLQSGFHQYEARLAETLDDTIARAVIDAATNNTDVFAALMTTRTWSLPSDRTETNGAACTKDADCQQMGFGSCTVEGVCGNSSAGYTAAAARVFNVEGVAPTPAGRWVDMPPAERSGVLTHPAWLAAHGNNFQDDPSLIHRGKWIRQSLFCETVPGLELVMVQAKLGKRAPTLSARNRVDAAMSANPTCLGCHQLMNSLGEPFEKYDHAGFLRAWDKYAEDAQGNPTTPSPPDAGSSITNLPDPSLNVAITDAVDFAERVAGSAYARRCFIRQAFRYFMGRDETLADQCTLTSMEDALKTGSFFDMIAVLAASDDVLFRTGGGL